MRGEPGKLGGDAASEPRLLVLRYGLKHLFWVVTCVALLVAVLVLMPRGMGPAALLLAVLVVVAHVIGTAIGSRLREHADEARAWEASQSGVDERVMEASMRVPVGSVALPLESKSGSPLYRRHRPLEHLGWWLGAGALVGVVLGVAGLVVLVGERASPAGIAVGAVSMAVVGAWLAFVVVNSWTIFREGWRDAVAERPKSRDDLGAG